MFGKILKERRVLLGYSQQEVAKKIGIERSYYSKIENGLRPSVKVAQKISEVLDVDWTIFFTKICVKNAQKTA
ncbi:helix-turn-helix transcriptional regulator [Lysinibacillus telephonicus]|uniref:helix-turn-helix domain-containing protein n=1 Tax=Lysinibacillus telephonicus TaxID=1714840 RepID=UPI0031FC1ECE